MKKLFLFFFVKLLLLSTFYSFAYSSEIEWIDDGFNTSDNYIQEYRKGFKEVNIGGKSEKFDITYYNTFPNKKYNKKNWLCREWTIIEYLNGENFLTKIYSLNDCLPCLDKGSGHICSYPYFKMEFKSKLGDKIFPEYKIKDSLEFLQDGTNFVKLSVNLSSRERVIIKKAKKSRENSEKFVFASSFVKYNTSYRQIPSEGIEFSTFTDPIDLSRYIIIFKRLVKNVNLAIDKKNKVKIREKDINSIISIEPGAKNFKFQTRD